MLGREADARRFFARAQGWRHLFDPATGFMRARVEGQWFTPFDPAEERNLSPSNTDKVTEMKASLERIQTAP